MRADRDSAVLKTDPGHWHEGALYGGIGGAVIGGALGLFLCRLAEGSCVSQVVELTLGGGLIGGFVGAVVAQ